jgi:hypothetical protein
VSSGQNKLLNGSENHKNDIRVETGFEFGLNYLPLKIMKVI